MKYFVRQLLLGILYFTHVIWAVEQDAGHTEYAILFDAGSSGTRMEIYHFLASGPSLQPSEVKQLHPSPHKEEPGIADLAEDPSKVEAYMMPLLESAKKTIPQDKHAASPIFLLATAGMRLLPEDQQNAILDEVRKLFKDKTKCPFLFEDDSDARVITGRTEGLYSWVTVNFLSGIFGSDKKTYGCLDLGGASHQNAFVLNEENPEIYFIFVGERNYSVFGRSYLGYGQDQARERYLGLIAQQVNCSNPQCVVESPCHNKGFKEALEFDDQERVFEGTAQVRLCRKIIGELFFCRSDDLQDCPFSNQPKLRGRFYGISAIYYVLNDIGAVCDDCENNKVTPRKVSLYSKQFCRKDYGEIMGNPYAKNNCFGANYIYELLTKGYKLGQYQKIAVASSLNGFDLGWTMGAVLHNTRILSQ